MIGGRHVVIAAGLGLAFAAGVYLPEKPARPEPRAVERTTVVRAAAGPDPAAIERMVRAAVRDELATDGSPKTEPTEPTEAELAEQDERRTRVAAVVAAARTRGTWTAADREAARELEPEVLVDTHRQLMEAIVAGDLVVELEGPLL